MKPTRALVWRSLALRYAVVAIPAWFTIAVLVFNTPWRLKLLVGGFFAAAVIAPAPALVAVSVAAPLGRFIVAALDLHTFRATEAIVVAFLAGWLLRRRPDPGGPRVPALLGWLAALAIAASIAGQAWRIAQYPGALGDTLRVLFQAYYIIPDRIGFGAGARLLEGIGLLAATISLFRSRPRLAVTLPIALTGSAVAAACASLLLTRHIGFAAIVTDLPRTFPRVAANVADINAAGSYFAMMLLVTVGMAAHQPSARSILWTACAAAEAAALWLAGSRSAVAATAIVGGAGLLFALTSRRSRRTRAVALAVVLVAAVAAGLVRAWTLRSDAGANFRRDFYETSARMIAARPAFGVGIGQYYDTSPLFLSRFLGWRYGIENAHNFFLQLAAELGVLGAAPLIALLAVAVGRGARAMLIRPDDMRLAGCECGMTALLATCLTGHPLLIDEVAAPFWIVTGLVLALSGPAPDSATGEAAGWRPPVRVASIAAAVVVMLSIGAARRPIQPSESIAVTGLEPWETAADGARYRWTLDSASIFVPHDATRVSIPIRLPPELPGLAGIEVEAHAVGVSRGRMVANRGWAALDVDLPPLETLQAYRRVDLKIDHTWQPSIYIPGSRDTRRVGVQVGEVKTFF